MKNCAMCGNPATGNGYCVKCNSDLKYCNRAMQSDNLYGKIAELEWHLKILRAVGNSPTLAAPQIIRRLKNAVQD